MNIQDDFKKSVIEGEFGVCELGSCQYSIINNMIDFIQRHRSEYSTLKQLLNQIDIKLSDYTLSDIETVKMDLIDPQMIKDNVGDWTNLTYECAKIMDICKAQTMDHLFITFRKCAFDLWTVAAMLSNHMFTKLKIEANDKPETSGPEWNQIMQSEGLINGIQCYLFIEHKLIKDTECLKDFDT